MSADSKLIKKLHEILDKSKQSLDDAEVLYKRKSYDSAASLAYYSVFHAIQAVLVTKGLAFSKHAQVKGAFNREFIHTGIFQKNFTQIVERLFKDRHVGDYGYGEHINEESAKKDIADARVVVKAIKEYLKKTYNQDF